MSRATAATPTDASRSVRSRPRQGRRALAAVMSITVVSVLATAAPALAEPSRPSSIKPSFNGYPDVAVITPTLGIFSFGATVGAPLLCTTALGAMTSFGNALGRSAGAFANRLAGDMSGYCSSVPNSFGRDIATFDTQLGPLAGINSFANPVLAALATATKDIGTQFGPAFAPYGSTIIQVGADIRFFEGS